MATTERFTTAGIIPSVNDLLAAVVIVGVYLVRIGTVAEGAPPGPLLAVTTDFALPILAALWIFGAATYVIVEPRLRE